jgi:hypothetical protein
MEELRDRTGTVDPAIQAWSRELLRLRDGMRLCRGFIKYVEQESQDNSAAKHNAPEGEGLLPGMGWRLMVGYPLVLIRLVHWTVGWRNDYVMRQLQNTAGFGENQGAQTILELTRTLPLWYQGGQSRVWPWPVSAAGKKTSMFM